jgi:hypothetical protein
VADSRDPKAEANVRLLGPRTRQLAPDGAAALLRPARERVAAVAVRVAPLRRHLEAGAYLAYFAGVAAFGAFLAGNHRPPPSTLYAPVLLLGVAVAARRLSWLRAWLPLVTILISYEALRGVAANLDAEVHWLWPIDADEILGFGTIPPIRLQRWFDHAWATPLDVATTVAYVQHFVGPGAFALYLWLRHRAAFRAFALALMAISLAGFATYLACPVAPPWMASERGLLPPIDRVVLDTLSHVVPGSLVDDAWARGDSNPVGAMPSLHVAWPIVVTFAAWPLARGRWCWALVAYPAFVSFAVVYTGEHYVVDVLAGTVYGVAGGAFALLLRPRSARGRDGAGSGLPRAVSAGSQLGPTVSDRSARG